MCLSGRMGVGVRAAISGCVVPPVDRGPACAFTHALTNCTFGLLGRLGIGLIVAENGKVERSIAANL